MPRYIPKKGGAATYQKRQLVLNDLFQKKTELFWTNRQLKDYMKDKYGYKENTANKYCEYLWQMIQDEVKVDYEQDLLETIEYMTRQIQNEPQSFIRLQWVKELNKIKGLQIKKVEVKGQINHIETIKIISHKRDMAVLANEIYQNEQLPEATFEPVVIPTITTEFEPMKNAKEEEGNSEIKS